MDPKLPAILLLLLVGTTLAQPAVLDATVARWVSQVGAQGWPAAAPLARTLDLVTWGPRVLLVIKLRGSALQALPHLEAAGFHTTAAVGQLAEGLIQTADITPLSKLPDVEQIQAPIFSDPVDPNPHPLPAPSANVTGSGITIAVVDSSFRKVGERVGAGAVIHGADQAAQRSPLLPARISGRRGTAVAAFLRKLAPEAGLHLIPAGGYRTEAAEASKERLQRITMVGYLEALQHVHDHGIRLIVSDVTFAKLPPQWAALLRKAEGDSVIPINDGGARLAEAIGQSAPGTRPRPQLPLKPVEIELASTAPEAKYSLHFSRPDGLDCWAGHPDLVWGPHHADVPRYSRSGHSQRIEIRHLAAGGPHLIWVCCAAAGRTGSAHMKLVVTGADGKPYPAEKDMVTGERWVPFGLEQREKDVHARPALLAASELPAHPRVTTPGLASLGLETAHSDTFVPAALGAPLHAGDKVRFRVRTSVPLHLYVAQLGLDGQPHLEWPPKSATARCNMESERVVPAEGGLRPRGDVWRVALLFAQEGLPDVVAGATGSHLAPILAQEPGWQNTLSLWGQPGDARAPVQLHSDRAANLHWVVLNLPVEH